MQFRVMARLTPFAALAEQAEAQFANSNRAEAYATTLIGEGYGLVTLIESDRIVAQWKHGEPVEVLAGESA